MESQERLKHFDNIFGTDIVKHIKFENMKLLKFLFNNFEEYIYTPSDKYLALRKKYIEIADELQKTFTQEQKELFERYWEVGNEMTAEENEQLFLYGYIISRELDIENKMSRD